MRELSIALGRRLAPHRGKFLHFAFFGSFGCLIAGWLLLDLLGPMSIILPSTLVIGTGLSEGERLFHPVLHRHSRPAHWISGTKKPSAGWSTEA